MRKIIIFTSLKLAEIGIPIALFFLSRPLGRFVYYEVYKCGGEMNGFDYFVFGVFVPVVAIILVVVLLAIVWFLACLNWEWAIEIEKKIKRRGR